MALTAQEQKTLDELVAHIADENEKKQVQALYEKHEPLRAGYLRQTDYDRNLNQYKSDLKKAKEESERAKAETRQMQDWWDKTKTALQWKQVGDDGSGRFVILEDLKAKNKELEERIRAAAAANVGNGDGTAMNQEIVTQMVMKSLDGREFVSKNEVNDLVQQAAKAIADKERQAFFERTLPAQTEFIETWQDIRWKHFDTFGKSLDRQALRSYWEEHREELKDKTPMEIYEAFSSDDTKKLSEQREVNERKKKEEQWQKEWLERQRRSRAEIPGSSELEEPPVGSPVYARLSMAPGKESDSSVKEEVKPPPMLAGRKEIRAATMRGVAALEKVGV